MNAANIKTPATVLQEIMVKRGLTPEYECISQTGPQHCAQFEFRCHALGCTVTAVAHSKKEARQEAARRMLAALAARNVPVPPQYAGQTPAPPVAKTGTDPHQGVAGGVAGAGGEVPAVNSYVALLKDLCEEYKLAAPDYELVSDTGPPHQRHFTMRVRVSGHARQATATTKKAARQDAARQLYSYLRENLARLTKDFDEDEALVRAHERAMQRYVEAREPAAWRPRLGQRLADYHLALFDHVDEEKRKVALDVVRAACEGECGEAEAALSAAAHELEVSVSYESLPGEPPVVVAELTPTLPELAFPGKTRAAAAHTAICFLRRALTATAKRPPPPPAPAAPPTPAS